MAKTTKAALLETGQLIRVYGSKTLIGVSPVPEIDRIRFSIVELNTNGRDFIDIYLTTEEFRQFCVDIDNGTAKKKIDADTGNYPTAYQWVKGENGSKKLIIGGGLKGIRVQASDTSDRENIKRKNALIQFTDLKELSFLFKLTSGLIPVQEGSYYYKLYHSFIDNIGKYRSNYNDKEDGNIVIKEEDISESKESKAIEEVVTTVSIGEIKHSTNNEDLIGIPVEVKETGEKTLLIFTKEIRENLSWFDTYTQRVNKAFTNNDVGVEMSVKVKRKPKSIYFIEVAKKA